MPKNKTISLLKRDTWVRQLIRDIKHFHAQTGMKFTTIGFKAIKNPRMWERLEKGGSITLCKADEVYEFMASKGYHFTQEGECNVQRTKR